MGTTNVYLKDWHRRFAGQRFSLFEQFYLENGTTSFEALVTAAELRPQQTVLELGCGEGPLLRYVLQRDVRYIGVDFSPRPSRRHDSRLPPPRRSSWKPMPGRCRCLTPHVMSCSRTWRCTS